VDIIGVGKSSMVYLVANNEVLTSAPYTVGCSVEVKLHEYKEDTKQEKTFFIELFDIGGSLSHRNTRSVFYQQTNGIILVHDATNRKSHENLKSWLYEIMSKESGKDTVKSSFNDQDLDSEQFLGSLQVSFIYDKLGQIFIILILFFSRCQF
jgi:Rab-like protein 3